MAQPCSVIDRHVSTRFVKQYGALDVSTSQTQQGGNNKEKILDEDEDLEMDNEDEEEEENEEKEERMMKMKKRMHVIETAPISCFLSIPNFKLKFAKLVAMFELILDSCLI